MKDNVPGLQGDFSFLGEFNLKGFAAFLKKNMALVCMTSFAAFFIYGIKLFHFTVGFDTVIHATDKRFINWIEIGRYGLVALQKLWMPELFSPYASVFAGFFLLIFGSLLHCFAAQVFSRGIFLQSHLALFSIVHITGAVWVEHFYYSLQTGEIMLIVALAPVAVWLLFYGILNRRPARIAASVVLCAFCVSVYQGILAMIFTCAFAYFIFIREFAPAGKSGSPESAWFVFCLKILAALFAALALYFAVNKIVLLATHTGNSAGINLLTMGIRAIYTFFPPDSKFVTDFVEPMIASHAKSGMKAVQFYRDNAGLKLFNVPYAVFLAVLSAVFLICLIQNKRKTVLTTLSAVCIPAFMLVLPVFVTQALRGNLTLSVSAGFMVLLILAHFSSGSRIAPAKIFSAVLAVFCFYQAQHDAALLYSDFMHFESDKRTAQKIDSALRDFIYANSLPDDTPVYILPFNKEKDDPLPRQEVCGRSFFEGSLFPIKRNGVSEQYSQPGSFMRLLGMKYNFTGDIGLVKNAVLKSDGIPIFPQPGSVVLIDGLILVKMGNFDDMTKSGRRAILFSEE